MGQIRVMILDSVIIGAGPAGIAVASELQKAGLEFRIYDKGPIGNHIMQFPVFMQFFSSREFLEIDKFPLAVPEEKPDRQQYLSYLRSFVSWHKLPLETFTEVTSVTKNNDIFNVTVQRLDGTKETIQSKTVVAACGAYERPRKLGIPGEDLPFASHHFTEPHKYFGKKVMVVGGRNSAIETALILFRNGADVSLSYRGKDFSESSIKYWIRPDIEGRIAKNEIKGYFETVPREILPGKVILADKDGRETEVKTDFVLMMTGYEPPLDFLKKIGVPFPPDSPVPLHNPETLETENPGMFVAGVVTAGNISGRVFIENSRHHGELITRRIIKII